MKNLYIHFLEREEFLKFLEFRSELVFIFKLSTLVYLKFRSGATQHNIHRMCIKFCKASDLILA